MARDTEPTALPARLGADYLEGLFAGARLAIIACEADGTILSWNRAAGALFPTLATESTGRPVCDLFTEEDRPMVRGCLADAVKSLAPQEFQWHVDKSETAPVVYGAVWTPVVRDDGTLQGASLWFRDITQRVRLKRAVAARQRLNVLGSLAGAVAHHYNNFLCSIATSMEFASNMTTTSAMRSALQRTVEAVNRAAHVTRQLLAFAQAERHESTFSDLTEIVLYYLDEHEQTLSDSNIRLRLDWQKIPVCPVPRETFQVVIDNLVQNAIEAMPNGGTLTVRIARHDSRHVGVRVSDSGPGFEHGALEHVFEPFFTTKGVLGSGSARNAGMGLAVVHGFISEMGGHVSATNLPGAGASLEVILPIKDHGNSGQ